MKNYTTEITKELVDLYLANPTSETVKKLAVKFDRPVKSIIGKLSKECVYRREGYKTKTGETPITKAEIVINICDELGIDELDGLVKTPKLTLKKLAEAVKAKGGEES